VRSAPPGEGVGILTPAPPALPVQGEAKPPPSKVPIELDRPEIPDVALPEPEHGVALAIGKPDDVALGTGLTPVVPISNAPRGIPAGPTDGLGVAPKGEVGRLLGGSTDGICAKAGLPLRRVAVMMAVNQDLMLYHTGSK
jgi:hypothetical protein